MQAGGFTVRITVSDQESFRAVFGCGAPGRTGAFVWGNEDRFGLPWSPSQCFSASCCSAVRCVAHTWGLVGHRPTGGDPASAVLANHFGLCLFSSEPLVVLETSGKPPSLKPVALVLTRHLGCLSVPCVEVGQPLSSLWEAICGTPRGPLVSTPDWLLNTGSGQTHHCGMFTTAHGSLQDSVELSR